ncbi:hypothetical protein SAMN02910298_02030 [Pseudobutyrivibrio sp. YE44]|uniref:hypothetical protein n=1 Tax=Pseudobutyrivibrio sp. YE44 TaxID=1520802 RepID=UPI00087E8CB8|nr:hypothetical protein [Pseudobutyrivibrio sp. YE44]SDB41111.1 hypothetical protein SAMN02910298_02030 [Pseudobutyrivibrio sp. YE44]
MDKNRLSVPKKIAVCLVVILLLHVISCFHFQLYRVFCAKIYYKVKYNISLDYAGSITSDSILLKMEDGNDICCIQNIFGIVKYDSYVSYKYGMEAAEEIQEIADNYFDESHTVYGAFADGAAAFYMYPIRKCKTLEGYISQDEVEENHVIFLQLPNDKDDIDDSTIDAFWEECKDLYSGSTYKIYITRIPRKIYDGTKDLKAYPMEKEAMFVPEKSQLFLESIDKYGTADYMCGHDINDYNGFIIKRCNFKDGEIWD